MLVGFELKLKLNLRQATQIKPRMFKHHDKYHQTSTCMNQDDIVQSTITARLDLIHIKIQWYSILNKAQQNKAQAINIMTTYQVLSYTTKAIISGVFDHERFDLLPS